MPIDLEEYSHLMYEHLTNDYAIRTYPNPVLTEISEPVAEEEFGVELLALGNQMVEIMKNHNGLGMAANQIGLLKRIMVMEASHGDAVIICNPEVELSTETDYHDEGCLSMPGVQEQVIRSKYVTLTFRTPMGAKATIVIEGMDARVVQHEFDHLNGLSFTDRLPRNLRRRVLRYLQEKAA